MKYGIVSNKDTLAFSSFQKLVEESNSQNKNGSIASFLPIDFGSFKELFTLFINRDNFKALGVLLNYAEQRKLKITSLDLSLFKPSLEYYLNHNFKFSNLLIFMKYYVYRQECLFKEFNLTPENLRKMSTGELSEYSNILFPHNNLADLRDLFAYLVKRLTLKDTSRLNSNEIIGSNRVIDNHTKQDLMEKFINYFTKYTVPFMDFSHVVNNFIRENDVADYYAGKFEEPNSFEAVMDLSLSYGERNIFQEFILDHLKKYKNRNFGHLPSSYSKQNIQKFTNNLQARIKKREVSPPSAKTNEILLFLMQHHKMINEMKKVSSPLKNHYITEAICNLKSDGSSDFYSSQVHKLFRTKIDKESELYTACMMKALLKEGDISSALRVLDQGEKAQVGRKNAIEKYYTKIYDHCFGEKDSKERYVEFFPDILKERDFRIQKDLERAERVSQYQKKLVDK